MPGIVAPLWISSPAEHIQQLFASSFDVRHASPYQFRELVTEDFKRRLVDANCREMIPWLNAASVDSDSFPKGSLVRFRGMLMDEQPAMYHQPFVDVRNRGTNDVQKRCTMFQESFQLEDNEEVVAHGSPESLCELQVFKCIESPGEVEWVRECYKQNSTGKSATADRKPGAYFLNFYAGAGKELRLNDVVDVYGILAPVPEPDAEKQAGDSSVSKEEISFPIIDVIYFEPVIHGHPELLNSKEALLLNHSETGRDLALLCLTPLLFGDAVAAEYLLMNLISTVHNRSAGSPLGNFPLNLVYQEADQTFAAELRDLLSNVLTRVVHYSATIPSLNTTQMVSALNPSSQNAELVRGFLQLPKHTHLVIDEVTMTEGNLVEQGVRNVLAIQRLIKDQTLLVEYFAQNVEFEMDIPVLILSQGRSLFSARYVVPIKASEHLVDVKGIILPASGVDILRKYLATTRLIDFHIEDEVREVIVNKFVEMRKNDRGVTGDDLHDLLEIARNLSLSYGRTTLTPDVWERVVELEQERRTRLLR